MYPTKSEAIVRQETFGVLIAGANWVSSNIKVSEGDEHQGTGKLRGIEN